MVKSHDARYEGALARPVHPRMIEMALVAGCADEWLTERHDNLISLLFQHYGISQADEACWLRLAVSLAHEHVPGFQVSEKLPIGRPSLNKLIPEDLALRLFKAYGYQVVPRSPRGGRPNNIHLDKRFVARVEVEKKKLKLHGRGSDKKALESLLRQEAKARNHSVTRKLQELPRWQSRLSRARRKLQKPAKIS